MCKGTTFFASMQILSDFCAYDGCAVSVSYAE